MVDLLDEAWKRGEEARQTLGIDGTMGDAQDVDHPYQHHAGVNWCVACGMAPAHSRHVG